LMGFVTMEEPADAAALTRAESILGSYSAGEPTLTKT